jgi:hypothetical protein
MRRSTQTHKLVVGAAIPTILVDCCITYGPIVSMAVPDNDRYSIDTCVWSRKDDCISIVSSSGILFLYHSRIMVSILWYIPNCW